MRVSYQWLKSLVNFSQTPEELAHVLTMAGLEVENLEPVEPELEGVCVGHVLEANPHPNADKLTLCKVDTGDEVTEVVCGAPNVQKGQKIAFIGVGGSLPNGMKIEERKLRGVLSRGMICSEVELGLGEDASGIMVLDPDAETGQPLRQYLGERDWSLELEITLNRADCLSHIGVAREIAAAFQLPFKIPEFRVEETGPPIDSLTSIEVEDTELCPRYSARVIQGVKISASPQWLIKRLEAVGLRSINNVVDATNYGMMEMGHPMHAFDLNQLEGRRIVVKCAENGEVFTTLDEAERKIDDRMLLICDAERGVALAGVMGGMNSEISDDTKDLLLESAYFDTINTRRTSRILGLSTDSSRRFERGADPNATVRALDMAASLIVQLAGGDVAKGVADVYPVSIDPWKVNLRPERVRAILGVDVDTGEMREHLIRLGCEVEGKAPFSVTVPTYRSDLSREIDLIEEIARLHGYNKVPVADRANVSFQATDSSEEIFQNDLINILVKLGFTQVMTSPLLAAPEAGLPGYPESVKVRNPGSEDMAFMRNGLFPGLLKVAAHNVNRGMSDLRLFEIGRVFAKEDDAEREWDAIAGFMLGINEPLCWDQEKQNAGYLDVKGAVEMLLRELRLDNPEIIYYNIGGADQFTADAARIICGDAEMGYFGQLHPQIASSFDIDVPIFAFELKVSELFNVSGRRQTYQAFPKYPALQRDLAFIVGEDVSTGDMMTSIRKAGGENLELCELFDVYRSEQIGKEHKSLAFRLSFQSDNRTLTDDEADGSIRGIIAKLEKNFGAKLRS